MTRWRKEGNEEEVMEKNYEKNRENEEHEYDEDKAGVEGGHLEEE